MADASHSMDKPAPQSVSQWVPPFTHTSSLPSARTLPANAAVLFSYETDLSHTVYSDQLVRTNHDKKQFIRAEGTPWARLGRAHNHGMIVRTTYNHRMIVTD